MKPVSLGCSHRTIYVSLAQWIPCRNRGTQIYKTPKTLGQFLRKRRAEKDLKQSEGAKQLGISTVSLSKWERDLFIPKAHYICRLSEYLGLSMRRTKHLPNA